MPKGAQKLSNGAEVLISAETKLQTGVNTLESESKKLSSGAKELSEGTKTLKEGSSEMQTGLNTLKNGTADLTEANNMLNDGAKTLSNGADTLANGMSKFNKEGISKICNVINGDMKDVSAKLEKLQELANEYDNFTMLNRNEAKGNVKFVMLIDGIKSREISRNREKR